MHRSFGVAGAALLCALLGVLLVGAVGVPETVAVARKTHSSSIASAPSRLTHIDLAFRSGDLTLHGTLVAPADRAEEIRLPGVVLVHGAGAGTRRERLLPAAEAFAAQGLVTFVYDKRSAGYTTSHRDFVQLADDAIAAARMLRGRPEVDPGAVGLWGVSEGGWVVPIAADRDPGLAFIVVVGANGISPAQQTAWALGEVTRRAGVNSQGQNGAGIKLVRLLDGAGEFAQAGYDPVPVLARVRQPLLAIWGGQDNSTPPGDGLRIFRDVLARSSHPSHTLRVFPAGNHGIGLAPGGVGEGQGDVFVPGYPELVGSWVRAVTAGQTPASDADPIPPQSLSSPRLRPLAWWEAPAVQLAAWALGIGAFTLYALTGLPGYGRRTWRRLCRQPVENSPVPRSATLLAIVAPVGLTGLGAYLIDLMGPRPTADPVLAGRSLEWLGLQLLALTTLTMIVVTFMDIRRTRKLSPQPLKRAVHGRLMILEAGAVVFTTLAAYWGLLQP